MSLTAFELALKYPELPDEPSDGHDYRKGHIWSRYARGEIGRLSDESLGSGKGVLAAVERHVPQSSAAYFSPTWEVLNLGAQKVRQFETAFALLGRIEPRLPLLVSRSFQRIHPFEALTKELNAKANSDILVADIDMLGLGMILWSLQPPRSPEAAIVNACFLKNLNESLYAEKALTRVWHLLWPLLTTWDRSFIVHRNEQGFPVEKSPDEIFVEVVFQSDFDALNEYIASDLALPSSDTSQSQMAPRI